MKRHFDGRECDIRSRQDIRKASGCLGRLHHCLRNLPLDGYPEKRNQFPQKSRELFTFSAFLYSYSVSLT